MQKEEIPTVQEQTVTDQEEIIMTAQVQATEDRTDRTLSLIHISDRSIVEYVEDPAMEISLADALKITSRAEIGGMIQAVSYTHLFDRCIIIIICRELTLGYPMSK